MSLSWGVHLPPNKHAHALNVFGGWTPHHTQCTNWQVSDRARTCVRQLSHFPVQLYICTAVPKMATRWLAGKAVVVVAPPPQIAARIAACGSCTSQFYSGSCYAVAATMQMQSDGN